MTEQTFPSYALYLPDHIQGPCFLYNAAYVAAGDKVRDFIEPTDVNVTGIHQITLVSGKWSDRVLPGAVLRVATGIDPTIFSTFGTVVTRDSDTVITVVEDLTGLTGPYQYKIIGNAMTRCGETDESGLGIDPKITYVDSKNAQFTHAVKTVMSEQGFDIKGVLMHGNPTIIQDFLGFPIGTHATTAATNTTFGVETTGFGEPDDPFAADMQCNYEAPYKTWFIRHPSPGFPFNPAPYGDGSVYNPRGTLGYIRLYKAAVIARTFKAFTHKAEFTCSFTVRAYIDDTIEGTGSRIGEWHTYQPKILT